MAVDLNSPSVGLDRRTGGVVTGWDDVLQSIEDIFTTRFGERVMREFYGSLVPGLLGRNMTKNEILKFFAGLSAALEQFEPRVRVARIVVLNAARDGSIGFEIQFLYRPRALLGDFTVEGVKRLRTAGSDSGVRLEAA